MATKTLSKESDIFIWIDFHGNKLLRYVQLRNIQPIVLFSLINSMESQK